MLGFILFKVSQRFTSICSLFRAHLRWGGGGNVAIEVFTCMVFNTDGIVLVRRILCYLCELVVLE